MSVDHDIQLVLERYSKLNLPPVQGLPVEMAHHYPTLKTAVDEMLDSPVLYPVRSITDKFIPPFNGDIPVRIYTPEATRPSGIMIYFHGGGWVMGNLDTCEPTCRALAHQTNMVVMSVDYRQAPEHKYPAAVDDAYTVTQWVLENADQFNSDYRSVVVAGESSGGNLAAVVCLKCRDRGKRMPAAQLLICPLLDARMNTRSYFENTDSQPLNSMMVPWFWKQYLIKESQKAESYVSPFLAQDLSGLPPAMIITAEHDPLRDEGEAYARRLTQAGVRVQAQRFDGTVHGFMALVGLCTKADMALGRAAEGLQDFLGTAALA